MSAWGHSTYSTERRLEHSDVACGLPVGVAAAARHPTFAMKRDITQVGELDSGINLYSYRYLWSDTTYVGVMAHEVAAVKPEAVLRGADGYLRVDYRRLGLRLQTWDQWTAAQQRG